MAFLDLESGIADLFAEADSSQVRELDKREAQILAWQRRRNVEKRRSLWLRWGFELKVKRARVRTWTIPLLPREVSCCRCRRDFANAKAMRAHWYELHERLKK